MNYKELAAKVFCKGTVPDGYFGDRASVRFAFHEGTTYVIHKRGLYRAPIPPAVDQNEAMPPSSTARRCGISHAPSR